MWMAQTKCNLLAKIPIKQIHLSKITSQSHSSKHRVQQFVSVGFLLLIWLRLLFLGHLRTKIKKEVAIVCVLYWCSITIRVFPGILAQIEPLGVVYAESTCSVCKQ